MTRLMVETHDRIRFLDGIRGLAILLVLFGHFTPFQWLGAFGVELFFALSGRLMAGILVTDRQPLGTFFPRRVARILPALVVFLTITGLVTWFAGVPHHLVLSSIAASGLFYSNYVIGGDIMAVVDHTWSLAVEEHTYLALALIVTLTARGKSQSARVAFGLSAILIAIACLRVAMNADPYFLYMRTETRMPSILLSFALGLTLPALLAKAPTFIRNWLAPAAFVVALLVASSNLPWLLINVARMCLLPLFVNAIDFSLPQLRELLEDRALRWFGLISFSLYLWQQPFHIFYMDGLLAPVAAALAVGAGALSYYFVETPARRRLRPLIDARASRPALSA